MSETNPLKDTEAKKNYSRKEVEELLEAAIILSGYKKAVFDWDVLSSRAFPEDMRRTREEIKPYRGNRYSQFKAISDMLESIDRHLLELEKKKNLQYTE